MMTQLANIYVTRPEQVEFLCTNHLAKIVAELVAEVSLVLNFFAVIVQMCLVMKCSSYTQCCVCDHRQFNTMFSNLCKCGVDVNFVE